MASELGNLILANKKDSTTRFVRHLLAVIKAIMQNLPTFFQSKVNEMQDALSINKHTLATKCFEDQKEMRDPKKLLSLLGLAQILEAYTSTSIASQYSKRYPSQVWQAVHDCQNYLDKLGEKWEWSEHVLYRASIDAPAVVVATLENEEVYTPRIFRQNVRNRSDCLRAGLITEDEDIGDLFYADGTPKKPLAGQLVMDPLEVGDKDEVEVYLADLCRKLKDDWREHAEETALDRALYYAFRNPRDLAQLETRAKKNIPEYVNEHPNITQENLVLYYIEHHILGNIVQALPPRDQREFSDDRMKYAATGYLDFNYYWLRKSNERNMDRPIAINEIYPMWLEEKVINEPVTNFIAQKCREFSFLFENCQIRLVYFFRKYSVLCSYIFRSASEAVCETLGSVMDNKTGKVFSSLIILFNID